MNQIPADKIFFVTEDERYDDSVDEIVHDFRGDLRRDWFINHAYSCLPLTIGNQMGFGIKTLFDFEVEWRGGDSPDDVILTQNEDSDNQFVGSHFGMGTFTLQNRFSIFTSEGINVMTIDPPNVINDGLRVMNAVVETDNLQRDFSYTIKVTRQNHKIKVPKGTIIAGVIPTKRYFIDGINLTHGSNSLDLSRLEYFRNSMKEFGRRRNEEDPHKPNGNGMLYLKGKNAYGCPFLDHQKGRIKKK